jgi:hypothetical protein
MSDRTSPAVLASHRNLWIVGTAMAFVVAAALLAFGPGDGSTCLFRAGTGVACPGCGMTRATAALLRGDWATMWRMHPLAAVVAAEGLAVWAFWGWTVFVRRRRVDETVMLYLLVVNTALLVVVWVVRLVTRTLPV